jgi:hypothetical protein
MIATGARSTWSVLPTRVAGVIAVLILSLFIAAVTLAMQGFALGIAAFLALVALAVWRPRYGLYAALVISVLFEPQSRDPFMSIGVFIHGNVSSWSPFSFVIFSPLELLLIATALTTVVAALVGRRPMRQGQLWLPLLVFLLLVGASLAFGVARGGNLNIALWETRSLFVAGLVALLVPTLLTERGHVTHVLNLLLIAVVLLTLDTIYRRFALVDTGKMGLSIEWAFEHETPVLMNFAVVLLVARLVWPASARARLAALLIPVIIYGQMLTERRAGWVCLDIGLALIVIFVFRLRRKMFYFLILPLLLVYVGYLGVFWNADGPIAEPARAVRSINDPEGRDVDSNLYRLMERLNIRENIHAQPVTGLGFGQQYIFYYPMADLSWWPFWHYIPHNGLLFLWMKMGPVGFIVFLTLCGAGLVRGVQLLKRASNDRSAPVLVAIVSLLLMLVVYSYVDIAMNNTRVTIMLGFVLGVIGAWGRALASEEAR